MKNNTLTISVNLVNNSSFDLFKDDKPETVLSEYLYPDSGAPISSYNITGKTDDGKYFKLCITNSTIDITID